MSRHENEDLTELEIPQDEITEKTYSVKSEICAKSVFFSRTKTTKLFVLCNGGRLFNPNMTNDTRYKKRSDWKMKRVNKSIFNAYLRFLKEKKEIYLHQAEREI